MSFEKINADDLSLSPTKAIGENWGILTGKDSSGYNSMTVSWGALGVIWGKKCVFVFVRPQRYTRKFLENGECFSLSLMPEGFHKKMEVFGSTSGRDTDKYAVSGFTAASSDGVEYCAQADTVFICRKIASGDISADWFADKSIDENIYQGKGYHRIYIGEIISVLKKR